MGGKLIAAQLTRPLLGATAGQAGVVFALTVPQAAATLAATTVGFQIGLFSESVVNAVLVLILVSVVVATLVAEREKLRVQVPPPADRVARRARSRRGRRPRRRAARRSGSRAPSPSARRASSTSSGCSRPPRPPPPRQAELDRLHGLCRRLGIDADPAIRVTDHVRRAAVLRRQRPRGVAAARRRRLPRARWADVAPLAAAPVAIVRGAQDRPLQTVRGASSATARTASRRGSPPPSRHGPSARATTASGELEARDVAITDVAGWDALTGPAPPDDVGLVLVTDGRR